MKSFFTTLVELLFGCFLVWVWTLMWNYGVVVVLARWYIVPTLSLVPAIVTGFLFWLFGVFCGGIYIFLNYELKVK